MNDLPNQFFYTKKEDKLNVISHGVGFILSIVGLYFLISKGLQNYQFTYFISLLIYGISLSLMYIASTLYHNSKTSSTRYKLRMFDMISIYILIAGSYTPTATVVNDNYLVAVLVEPTVEIAVHYFQGVVGAWEKLDSASTGTVTYAPHYSAPASPTTGDTWIKTTTPGNGINLAIYSASAAGVFGAETVEGVSGQGNTTFVKQDGTSVATITTLTNSNIQLELFASATGGLTINNTAGNTSTPIGATAYAQDAEPTGNPANGALWFNNTRTDLDILGLQMFFLA